MRELIQRAKLTPPYISIVIPVTVVVTVSIFISIISKVTVCW